MLYMFLLTSAARLLIYNTLVETEKGGLTCWERVSPNETCIRVRERCVWAFYEAKINDKEPLWPL